MDPLNPFTFPSSDPDLLLPVSKDAKQAIEEVEKDVEVILKLGKERLGSRYAAFQAYMRKASAAIAETTVELLRENGEFSRVDAVTKAGREVLLSTASSFDRETLSYEAVKAVVQSSRQQNRDAVQEMTKSFGRINVQEKLNEDPLWAYKRDKIAQNMAVAQISAFVAEQMGEFTKWFLKNSFGCLPGHRNEHFCRNTLNFAKELGKGALAATGLKEPLKRAVTAITTTPEPLVQELGGQFGFSREQAEQYYQNGLIHMANLVLPPALKLAGVGARGAWHETNAFGKSIWTGACSKVNQLQDKRGVTVLIKALEANSIEFEGMIDFASRMQQVAYRVKDYSTGTQKKSVAQFIETLPGGPAFVQDSARVLPKIAQGRSGASVFFVGHDDLAPLFVVKTFPAMATPNGKFAREILAYETYKNLQMTHLDFPRLLKVGKYKATEGIHEHGLLAMTPVKGESLAITFDAIAKTTGEARLEGLRAFTFPMEKAGRALAELHRKSLQSTPVATQFMCEEIEALRALHTVVLGEARNIGIELTFSDASLTKTINGFKYNSGGASLVHGDAHLPNFFWNRETKTLTAIDTSDLVNSLNHALQPIGAGVKDYIQWNEMLRRYGASTGISSNEVEVLKKAFQKGYKEEFGYFHTQEAIHFYEVYWRMRSLGGIFSSKAPSLEEAREVISQLNKLAK